MVVKLMLPTMTTLGKTLALVVMLGVLGFVSVASFEVVESGKKWTVTDMSPPTDMVACVTPEPPIVRALCPVGQIATRCTCRTVD